MEKTGLGIVALVLGILGSIFLLVGGINFLVLPSLGKVIGGSFALIGLVFLINVFFLVRIIKKQESSKMEVIINGLKLEAEIIEVKQNTSITINNRHPYVLVCEAQGHTFESEYFYRDVEKWLNRTTVDVYWNEDTDEYYVDLDS